jgi:hypothetical protein
LMSRWMKPRLRGARTPCVAAGHVGALAEAERRQSADVAGLEWRLGDQARRALAAAEAHSGAARKEELKLGEAAAGAAARVRG